MKKIIMSILLLTVNTVCKCQTTDSEKDSLYIAHIEDTQEPNKVFHAEPLYVDLIRDLGARKGEKEWNIGMGITDNLRFDTYQTLVEYEWAPINRLGFEVELPFTFYSPMKGTNKDSLPSNKLNSLKMAAQWSFLVDEVHALSMALGYINEFELSDFKNFGDPLFTGNVYNPFLVVAKRWGNNLHSLVYTGPRIAQHFGYDNLHKVYDINTSFHYMISGTRNFIGIEMNKTLENGYYNMTLRPQMRLGIADNFLIGIVAGIPISRENERLSSFLRLIWEPGHTRKV